MSEFTIKDKVAIAGLGETIYYKRGSAPVSEFRLALEAIQRAADDAGIPVTAIDGIASYSNDRNDSVRGATALGLPELRFSNMFWGGGGGGGSGTIGNAAAAIVAGFATCVVVYRALAQGQFGRFGRLPEAAELALCEGSIHHDAGREAGHYSGCGVADSARASTTAAAPEHVGEAQLGKSERGRDPDRIVAVIAVGRDPVDRGDRNPGVIGGALNRFEREPELADRRTAAFVVDGLAEAGDSHLVLDREFAHRQPLRSHLAKCAQESKGKQGGSGQLE